LFFAGDRAVEELRARLGQASELRAETERQRARADEVERKLLADERTGDNPSYHARIAEALGLVEEATVDDILRVIAERHAEEREAVRVLASYCPEADPGKLSLSGVVNLLESDVLSYGSTEP
jgi:hypothetical protein